ncbi:MAG: rane protein [Phycisphaerales bacterium]|nr:rane protein [Phycisphaerales bacterium]
MEAHSDRDLIWKELHARPYVRFTGPAHVFHFAFLSADGFAIADHAGLNRLRQSMGLRPTYETARHAIYTAAVPHLGRLVAAWERHTDFLACTFFLYDLEIPFQPFGLDCGSFLPDGFFQNFDAPPLVATRIAIGSRNEMPHTLDGLTPLFDDHTVNGSRVMAGRAEVFSDYRVHADGFGRIAIVVHQMSPQDLGRTVERLLVIEDSYHLALLSLPLARKVKFDLGQWEDQLVRQMEALRRAESMEHKRAVLDSLLELAAEIESLRAKVFSQFARSADSILLLQGRLRELREGKIEHILRLSRFLMRRLSPAAQTHRDVLQRLTQLSQRIDRGADLLRTSIDLNVEEQNKRLLESVNRRARLQLELQHAVEGLSVIILAYYTLGLIGYVLKGAHHLGLSIDPEIALAIAAPILLLLLWGLIAVIRRRLRDRS